MTNEVTQSERVDMYGARGVLVVTARILLVDLLSGRLQPSAVSGLCVLDAHEVAEVSMEGFALRLFAQGNREGFVRAFSEEPERISGQFSGLAKLMRSLRAPGLVLLPRQLPAVRDALRDAQPEVEELAVAPTEPMRLIQRTLFVALEGVLREIRRGCSLLDESALTMERGLGAGFEAGLRTQLAADWHRVSASTRRLVQDASTVRRLLELLVHADAVDFLLFLCSLRQPAPPAAFKGSAAAAPASTPSMWLGTHAADVLFEAARARVYRVGPFPLGHRHGRTQDRTLCPALEEPPKWRALCEAVRGCAGPVLVLVRSERAAALVSDVLCSSPARVAEMRYRGFVAHQAMGVRARQTQGEGRAEEDALFLQEELYLQGGGSVRKARDCAEPQQAPAARADDGREEQGRGEEEGSQTSAEGEEVALVAGAEVVVLSHARAKGLGDALGQLRPSLVVMFDADLWLLRAVEVHQGERADRLRVCFLMYEGSVEEHRYVSAVRAERRAFEQLAAAGERLVLSMPDDAREVERDRRHREEVTYSADGRSLEVLATSQRKRARPSDPAVVVDVRELRSSLPNILDSQGVRLCPVTLTVGDYVLAPSLALERKGLSDLFQSLQSGRLYAQMDALTKHYPHAGLLIEFAADKPFAMQSAAEVGSELKASHICARMAMLVLAFPAMRVFWSRSAYCTAALFLSLKAGREEPSESEAVRVGCEDGDAPAEGAGETERAAAQEVLLSLPGINHTNVRAATRAFDSLAAMCLLAEAELAAVVGPANARKLHTFLHHRVIAQY